MATKSKTVVSDGNCVSEDAFKKMMEQQAKLAKEMEEYYAKNEDALWRTVTLVRKNFLTKSGSTKGSGSGTVWLSGFVMRLPFIFDTSGTIPTACTDGKEVRSSPKFWHELPEKQRLFVLAHEVMHVVMGHANTRRVTGRYAMLWNWAADMWVNTVLVQSGVGEAMPGGILPDSNDNNTCSMEINGKKCVVKNVREKTVETIYEELSKHVKDNPPKEGDGKDGDVIYDRVYQGGREKKGFDRHDFGKMSKEDEEKRQNQLREEWVRHKMQGHLPGWLAEHLERELQGSVDWRHYVRQGIEPLTRSDSTWMRVDRRSESVGARLPGSKMEGSRVMIYIDTSGSIGKNELAYFTGECRSIMKSLPSGGVQAKVCLHHTDVYAEYDLMTDDFDTDEWKIVSGGTSHLDVFKHAEENVDEKYLIVMLTDGYSSFPKKTSLNRIVWVVTTDTPIPDGLGQVVRAGKIGEDA